MIPFILSDKVLKELQSILDKGELLVSESEVLTYSYDASSLTKKPSAVILPEKKEEVIEILKIAQKYKIPVTPRGAGTATTGSAIAHTGGLILCFTKMNRILELNEEERIVRVQPGVVNGDLKKYLKKHGLFYPPDPASFSFSTIGGNVATGAGGPKGLKYGTTKDYVISLEVVLPGGKVFQTGPPTLKGVVPYNLTSLFVGSEGTLGVFTEIILKVIPLPERRLLFISGHKKEEEPLEIISELLKRKITPSSAEFVDKTSFSALKLTIKDEKFKTFYRFNSLLFLELDGDESSLKREEKIVENFYKDLEIYFIKAEEETEIENFWEIRRSISPALKVLGERKISDDVVVPRRFMKILLYKIREIEKEAQLNISCFGHAGDGNFHVDIHFNPDKEKQAILARERILKEVLSLSGTISGEHGIGYTKRSFISLELTPLQIEIMKRIKKIFDPDGILNPQIKLLD